MIYLCHGAKWKVVLGRFRPKMRRSDLVSLLFFGLQKMMALKITKGLVVELVLGVSIHPMVGDFLRKLCGFSIPNF